MGELVDDKPKTVRSELEALQQQFEFALPAHIPVERFMRVVMTAINANPALQNADRRSLFEAAMKAAQDGLLPDGVDGAFVTFKSKVAEKGSTDKWVDKVQWMPMIRGILKKIRNSGELQELSAHVVYAGDRFEYRLGDNECIEHFPSLLNRGNPVAVYAIAKTVGGGIYREVMTIEDVEKVRAASRAKDGGPWTQWWGEMARKTVIRRLSKRLPMSTDLDDLIRRDDDLYDMEGASDARQKRRSLGERAKAGMVIEGVSGLSADHIAAELPAAPAPLKCGDTELAPPSEDWETTAWLKFVEECRQAKGPSALPDVPEGLDAGDARIFEAVRSAYKAVLLKSTPKCEAGQIEAWVEACGA